MRLNPRRSAWKLAGAATLVALALTGCASTSGNPDSASQAATGADEDLFGGLLKDIMPPTPGQVARDAFNVYDPDKRRKAIALLSASDFGGEAPYVHLYRILLDDPDASVRAACLHALGLHGTVEDVAKVTPYLSDATPFVRWEAAGALQKLHAPAAVDPLLKAAKDDDSDVRMAACTALGQYPQPLVYDVLVGAMDDADYGVAWAAHRSLVTLTGYDFGPDATLWLIWSQRHTGDARFIYRALYYWQPYIAPVSWYDWMAFWDLPQTPAPRLPAGMEITSAAPASAPGSPAPAQ